jgi:hypothetical protein
MPRTTAWAVGPRWVFDRHRDLAELILPGESLPDICGSAAPEFDTEDEMQTVLGTIMRRCTISPPVLVAPE